LTNPIPAGSNTASMMIGIVFVALAAARVAATFAASNRAPRCSHFIGF
jgi:hypothetical protein